jgi:hypothetical protein
MRSLLLLPLLVLTACAAQGGSGSAAEPTSSSPAASSSASGDELQISIDRGDGSEPEKYTLTCGDTIGGSLPNAQAACDHLVKTPSPFAPLPTDAMCAEIYGGPQTAHITGTWRGEPVDLQLSRVDGCRIAQWDRLRPLLPGPVGASPPS